MFGKIAAFELRYQVRQPIFWIAGLIFFLLVFGSMTVDQVQVSFGGGNVHKNSPQAIALNMLVWTVFYMFASTAFVAGTVIRDDETGFGPIIRSTRISKFDYLFGRFCGSFVAVAIAWGEFLWMLPPEPIWIWSTVTEPNTSRKKIRPAIQKIGWRSW